MKTYSLTSRAEGDNYHRLLVTCSEFASLAGLVQGSPTRQPTDSEFLRSASAFLVREDRVLEFPGGIGHTPRQRWLYTYNPAFIRVLESASSDLFDWLRPELPEDLHLLRNDGSTVLGTVASEEHAYVRLEDSEVSRWLLEWPASIVLQE